MNKRCGDIRSRGDITETVDGSRDELNEKNEVLEQVSRDVETTREVLDKCSFVGTSEGVDQAQRSITEAEDIAVETFDTEDGALEEIQGQNDEFQSELGENAESVQDDINDVTDASSRIATDVAVERLVAARDALQEDVDFLTEQIERAKEAREASEEAQRVYQNTVHGA